MKGVSVHIYCIDDVGYIHKMDSIANRDKAENVPSAVDPNQWSNLR